jgi:hypothetical protein
MSQPPEEAWFRFTGSCTFILALIVPTLFFGCGLAYTIVKSDETAGHRRNRPAGSGAS